MLLEHFEEEFDLPAVPVDSADGGCSKAKMVGKKLDLSLVLFVTKITSVRLNCLPIICVSVRQPSRSIYRDRWEIELFFKVLKQHLKIKTLVGTSPNALKTQIWTALIAVLLLKYLQFRSKCNFPLCRLVALLRLNLFSYP